MSYTNSTPNYGLPQWLAADKPKFLTDINNAFSTIDTQLKNANDTANTADDNATSALSIAGQAATTAEGAATVAGQAAALAQSVNELVGTLNAKMGTTSIATIGDGTVTGALADLDARAKYKILKHELTLSFNNAAFARLDFSPETETGYTPIAVAGVMLSSANYCIVQFKTSTISIGTRDLQVVTADVGVDVYILYAGD